MTKTGYEEIVRQCTTDEIMFDLVVMSLIEAQEAKELLREKGYGVTGVGILETAREVPHAHSA